MIKNNNSVFIYHTEENSEGSLLSLENHQRITKVAPFLAKKFTLHSSKTLSRDPLQVYKFIQTVYDLAYVQKKVFLKNHPSETLCDKCSLSNPVGKKRCIICQCRLNHKVMKWYEEGDSDTLFSSLTADQILHVCSILLDIVKNPSRFIYALIRPPGHHSSCNSHSGFCIINNAFLLAKQFPKERVFIMDWDLHHGDGTQELVEKDMESQTAIYYCSIHGKEDGFFPGTGEAQQTEKVLNIPLPRKTENAEYWRHFWTRVVPFFESKKADVLIISNGLDAHKEDLIPFFNTDDEIFVEMTQYFRDWAVKENKRIIYLLEGGYNTNVIARVSEKIINCLEKN